MATEAQMNANKANAQHSTGPTSEGGKNISRFNALQHGYYAKVPCLPGQSLEEWQALLEKCVQQNGVETFPQFFCAAQAAQAEFRLAHLHDRELKLFEEHPERREPNLNISEYDEKRLCIRENQAFRREMHLLRVRDKNLTQLRLLKKDEADAEKRAKQRMKSPMPAPVAEPPVCNESSPDTGADNEAELERQRLIREESEKFYLEMAGKGWAVEELDAQFMTYLKTKGLIADPPQPTVI